MKNNYALIIGHAGHELRVLKFIKQYKPLVFVLTDGSGSKGVPRIESSRAIFKKCGCKTSSSLFGNFTDKDIYGAILKKDFDSIKLIVQTIKKELVWHDINFVFGDACEGFNPTHDLCRYIINACVNQARKIRPVENYDFLLDLPHKRTGEEDEISFLLSEKDKKARNRIIDNYPELESEVEMARQRFGENAFDVECIRKVKSTSILKTWKGEKPYYETFGEKRKSEGVYSEVITFKTHLLPIAKRLIQ